MLIRALARTHGSIGTHVGTSLAALAICGALVATPGPAESATAITACGQHVKGSAYLTGDLDCFDSNVPAGVVFEGSGRLDLRGFAVRGAPVGVRCDRNCSVANGTLQSNTDAVVSLDGGIKLTDVVVLGYGVGDGASAKKNVLARRVAIGDVTRGIVASRGSAKLHDVQFTGTVRKCARAAKKVVVKDSTIVGCVEYGLYSGDRIALVRTAVTGSGTEADCNDDIQKVCGDVLSWNEPKLSDSTCGTSVWLGPFMQFPDPFGFGICANE